MTHTPTPDTDIPTRITTPATARMHLRATEQRHLRTAKAIIAQRIRTAISGHRWTQEQAATELGVGVYTIRRIQRLHTNTLTLDVLLTVAARLDITFTLTTTGVSTTHTHPTEVTP